MICAMCLIADTPDQVCKPCMGSMKYAEDFIKREGVGLSVTFNRERPPFTIERGDLSIPPKETTHWVAEVTATQDRTGELDQPVYTGKADTLKEACELALDKLKEDLK